MIKEQQPQTGCTINREALKNYMTGYDPKGVIEKTTEKLTTNPDRVCLNDNERYAQDLAAEMERSRGDFF